MDNLTHSPTARCWWAHRLEILGLILLIIAICLTIRTHSSVGIFMLFVGGIVFCCHKCIADLFICHSHDDSCAPCTIEEEPVITTKTKTPRVK